LIPSIHYDKVLGLFQVRVNPEDLVLWSGQSYQMSATAFHVEGKEIECAEFEWNLEDSFVARLKGSEVEGKSAGQTHIWAILTSQNLRFFAGQGLVRVWEWREFSSPSGRKTNVIYNERRLPIYVEELNKDGKVIFVGQYSYHPLLEEITESVLSFEGRGVKVVMRDYDPDCSLEDKTRPNEHPGDKVFCIEERKCDEDGNCSVYRKVIRNYGEGGRSIAEIEDSLGRKERIIFEFPDEDKMRVIKENARGHKVEELYQMFSDGKEKYQLLIRYKDENGIETIYEREKDGRLKGIIKKGIRPDGKDYVIGIVRDGDVVKIKSNTGHEIRLYGGGEKKVEYLVRGKKVAEVLSEDLGGGKKKTILKVEGLFTREEIRDGEGNLLEIRERGPNGEEKRRKHIYDEKGRLVGIDDGVLKEEIVYDERGKVIEQRTVWSDEFVDFQTYEEKEVLGGRRYWYDYEGNLTASQSISKGDGYGSEFNEFYEITKAIYFSGKAKAEYEQEYNIDFRLKRRGRAGFEDDFFRYDVLARLVQREDKMSGVKEKYFYDELDRVLVKEWELGAEKEREDYFYDGENPLGYEVRYGVGRQTGVRKSGYEMAKSYTPGGVVSEEIKKIGEDIFKTSYIYAFDGISLSESALWKEIGKVYPSGASAYFGEDGIYFGGKKILGFSEMRNGDRKDVVFYGNGVSEVSGEREIFVYRGNESLFSSAVIYDVDLKERVEVVKE
jgi:hypothetical protein